MRHIELTIKLKDLKSNLMNSFNFQHVLGPFNATNEDWFGVMGSVVTGRVPISIGAWIPNTKRFDVCDIPPAYSDRPVLAVVNR